MPPKLPVHGVVLIGDQNRENRETIEKFGHVRVIGEIPKLPNLHRTALMQVFLNHFDRSAFSRNELAAANLAPVLQLCPGSSAAACHEAEGVHLYTSDGRQIIDAISSWWVNLHGHANPRIAAAIARTGPQDSNK